MLDDSSWLDYACIAFNDQDLEFPFGFDMRKM